MKTGKSYYRNKASSTEKSNSSRIVIITGLSGSGKTVALRAVEDADYFCVDNLPVSLISSLVSKLSSNTEIRNIAVGIDIREKEFLRNIDKTLNFLKNRHRIEILFLEAETDVLIRRFKETRRPHPLGGNLEDAIRIERDHLSLLKENADRVIDTSSFSPHQLRKLVTSLYVPKVNLKDMTVSLISFGFKYGVPQNVDLLFDVRFLPNPNFIPSLKPLNGKDRPVVKYLFRHWETKEFMKKVGGLLDFLIPLYIKEGKSYLAIAFGCTGGNHRSPAIVEEIVKSLKKNNLDLNIIHRDIS
ncbi:MAG: RNase adapter RapZ [Nitrospirota bacterium]